MTQKQLKKQNDSRIERAYYANCSGIAIDIMDIGKVFRHGDELIAAGADDAALGKGLLEYVKTLA